MKIQINVPDRLEIELLKYKQENGLNNKEQTILSVLEAYFKKVK